MRRSLAAHCFGIAIVLFLSAVGALQAATAPVGRLIATQGDVRLRPAGEAGWGEALDYIAGRFKAIRDQHGPDALAGLASARCTNEENYLFQKFMRAVIGTNNVDHCARL